MSAINILVADDDTDDCRLIKEAFKEAKLSNSLNFVHNGQELLDYLSDCLVKDSKNDLPGLILLDLNMPVMDGREALKEIKSNPDFKLIPVVVLTTSREQEDLYQTYNLGVNSFICKPISFDHFVDVVQTLEKYWFEIVHLPVLAPKE